jgi:mRNA interferase RelE/StbE
VSDYTLTFAGSARKELESLDESLVNRIFPKIELLAKEPRPHGCQKLRGDRFLWRIRIGDYRVVYGIYDDKKTVDIIAVRHRREAYR